LVDLNDFKHFETTSNGGSRRSKKCIDHVVPNSWFEYSSTKDESFKECWSLGNLQPMWKLDNISKGNRSSGLYKEGG